MSLTHPPDNHHPRILIVRLSALGDVLDTTPVAEAIKRAYPQATVGWVVERRCSPILDGNPFIDRLHVWDHSLSRSLRLIRELHASRYDVTVDIQGLLKSGVISRVTCARQRLVLEDARESSGRLHTTRIPRKRSYTRVAERALGILKGLDIDADPSQFQLYMPSSEMDRRRARQWMERAGLEPGRYFVLAPATTTPQRHWVPERWAQLAAGLRASFGANCVLLAGASDLPLLEQIRSHAGVDLPYSPGDLSLRESACLARESMGIIGLDSFLLHVGLAVNTPVIALFGPTPTTRFQGEPDLTIVEKPLPCRPCGRNPTCGGAFTCMTMIELEDVMGAAEAIAKGGIHAKPVAEDTSR